MKRFIVFFLIILFAGAVMGEEGKTKKFQEVMNRFVDNYNDEDYKIMADDFSQEMLKEMPLEKSKSLFKGFFMQYGRIVKLESPVFKDQDQAIFTARFESGILNIAIALDKENKILGLVFMPYKPDIPAAEKNKTELSLPFKGKWFVLWGGDTKELNCHNDQENQKFAFDFVIIDDSKCTHKDIGEKNEDYYAFGKEVLAPADGTVTDVIDGVRDNIPGSKNIYSSLGNSIFIQHSDYEVSVFSHLKFGSIKLHVGDKVKKGDVIGLCGNSGDSFEPHIQYHLQNTPIIQYGTGIKCYFQKIMVIRSAKKDLRTNYSPLMGDFVSEQ